MPVTGFDTNGPLANTLSFSARTPDRQPPIQINSAKNILPTSSNSQIPVSTINISKLNIDIYELYVFPNLDISISRNVKINSAPKPKRRYFLKCKMGMIL